MLSVSQKKMCHVCISHKLPHPRFEVLQSAIITQSFETGVIYGPRFWDLLRPEQPICAAKWHNFQFYFFELEFYYFLSNERRSRELRPASKLLPNRSWLCHWYSADTAGQQTGKDPTKDILIQLGELGKVTLHSYGRSLSIKYLTFAQWSRFHLMVMIYIYRRSYCKCAISERLLQLFTWTKNT